MGQALLTLAGHRQMVRSCAFSPDGRVILTHSSDGTEGLWDAQTGTEVGALQLWACNFSPDGLRMVFASLQSLRLWDTTTHTVPCEWRSAANILAWSPEGRRLAVATQAGAVALLRLETLIVGPVLATPWRSPINGASTFGCPLCRAWSEATPSAFGTAIQCPRCRGSIRLNALAIQADWRPVSGAW